MSSAANSKMVTVELLKLYCLPFLLCGVEAMSLSSTNVRSLENCINRAMYRIFYHVIKLVWNILECVLNWII